MQASRVVFIKRTDNIRSAERCPDQRDASSRPELGFACPFGTELEARGKNEHSGHLSSPLLLVVIPRRSGLCDPG
jgi:hypothetical protein